YRTDLEGIITFVSQSCFKMSGYKVEELIGTIAADYLFFDVTQNRVFLKEISIHGYVDSYESKLKKKDGSTWWASTNAHYYKNIYGKILGVEGVTRDITAKKQVEIELQSFKNYLSNIIDSMPSILVGVNALGEVTFWNKTAEVATGITTSMAQGKSLTEVFPIMAPEMEKIKESIHTRQVKLEQNRSRKKGDEILFEDITIYPLITNGVEGAVIRVDDVTNQFRLHEIMIQSEKMLSVGGLAAGMAHEINNPLAGMLQTANVMSSRLNISRKNTANKEAAEKAGTTLQVIESYMELRGIPSMIEKINESGRRIAAIVNNMLSFARKSEDDFSTYDIPFLLDKTLKLAETDYDFKKQYDFKQINILKEYAENIPHLPCDISKIQQVFLNILRNGAQAMQSAKISDPQLIIRVFIKDNEKKLTIEIEDNGPGLSNEIKSKIFEPFFTTKPIGVGTGLGLSVSYFIITETHNGDLYVESNNDRGSKFIIKLPI
ncbi:MAG: PAS domain S-box protein, partial [Spirochaetaceae bacterium]|nr:PAS domain S-box protein [Spirochaetaceae bacterium]